MCAITWHILKVVTIFILTLKDLNLIMKNTVGKKKRKKQQKESKETVIVWNTPSQSAHDSLRDLVKMQILIHQVWAWDLRFCTSNKLSGDTGAAGPALMAEQGTLGPRILRWHKEVCYHCREHSHPSHLQKQQELKATKRNRNTGRAPRPAQDWGCTRRTGELPTWPQLCPECGGSAESWGQSLDSEKNSLAHQATH